MLGSVEFPLSLQLNVDHMHEIFSQQNLFDTSNIKVSKWEEGVFLTMERNFPRDSRGS